MKTKKCTYCEYVLGTAAPNEDGDALILCEEHAKGTVFSKNKLIKPMLRRGDKQTTTRAKRPGIRSKLSRKIRTKNMKSLEQTDKKVRRAINIMAVVLSMIVIAQAIYIMMCCQGC